MADIGISRHDMPAAYDMAAGCCPWCAFDHALTCNVCGGTGRLLPYRVDEGVRCVTCNEFSRESDGSRYCDLIDSPLWSPWVWHACPYWAISEVHARRLNSVEVWTAS